MPPAVKRWLTIVGCTAYVFSPIDILPEAALGPFGLPDDVIAVLVALKALFLDGRKPA